jgi:hypothetical protein
VGDEKNIYAFYKTQVNRIDIKAKSIYPDISSKDIPSNKDIPDLPVMSDAKGINFDENNKVWLFFTNKKIGLWDTNQKSLQWLFHDGNDIEQAFWANNGSAILFRDGNQAFLLDKQSFGQTKLQKVTRIRPKSSIHYSEKTGKLYYIEPMNRLLSTIGILRHRPILPKTIADTLRLKEFEP